MDKFIYGFIKIEKSIQIVSLLGVIMFVGYVGAMNYRNDLAPSSPLTSPIIQK
jgi:hypothetical protein